MVTGDHFETARFVAHKAGIISRHESTHHEREQSAVNKYVLTGEQFKERIGNYEINQQTNVVKFESIDRFRSVAKFVRVIARATDEDKLLLCEGLR